MTGLSNLQRYLPAMAAERGLVELGGCCDQHGPFTVLGVPGSTARCPACWMAEERSAGEAERREHMLRRSGIPRKYREARFRDLLPVCDEQGAVLSAVKGWVGRLGRGERVENLVIHGGPGTGKTHMASAAMLNLIQRCGLFARYATTCEMVDEIASSWGVPGRSESGELLRFGQYRLLVLDEVDVFDNPNPAMRHLNMVINHRYNEGLPTVFVTNQTPARLGEILGQRAVSRMFEDALVLACPWEDYRKRAA
ncbi:DNA replication protein DnaC [Pseudogulbenkiania sp. NH8B]|uniref:ATP-binding protein n=1 Tax=Pseudogulbenkiania sp. (strain NH8B) TaxID=748280 RepID=UPI0002279A8B|nr:ATP-binding protein [Pseudogulbenkiania sp. NH8B]BAK75805.1 DNA replication protein DnaC [Pseudogulbenkiania sp. NH8B]